MRHQPGGGWRIRDRASVRERKGDFALSFYVGQQIRPPPGDCASHELRRMFILGSMFLLRRKRGLYASWLIQKAPCVRRSRRRLFPIFYSLTPGGRLLSLNEESKQRRFSKPSGGGVKTLSRGKGASLRWIRAKRESTANTRRPTFCPVRFRLTSAQPARVCGYRSFA